MEAAGGAGEAAQALPLPSLPFPGLGQFREGARCVCRGFWDGGSCVCGMGAQMRSETAGGGWEMPLSLCHPPMGVGTAQAPSPVPSQG